MLLSVMRVHVFCKCHFFVCEISPCGELPCMRGVWVLSVRGCTLENQSFFIGRAQSGQQLRANFYQLCLLVVMDLYGDIRASVKLAMPFSFSFYWFFFRFLSIFIFLFKKFFFVPFSYFFFGTAVHARRYLKCLSVYTYTYIFVHTYTYIPITLNHMFVCLFVGFITNRLPRFANWVADFLLLCFIFIYLRLIRGRVVFVSVYALGVCTSASGLWHFFH